MITTMPSDQSGPPPRVEVITSVQRRRRWPTAEKIRLVEETTQSGMSVSYVARRAGVARSLLFNWRRRMIEGGLQAVETDEDLGCGGDFCTLILVGQMLPTFGKATDEECGVNVTGD